MCQTPVRCCTHLEACATEPSQEQKNLASSSTAQLSRVTRGREQTSLGVSGLHREEKRQVGFNVGIEPAVTHRQPSTAPCRHGAYFPLQTFLRSFLP